LLHPTRTARVYEGEENILSSVWSNVRATVVSSST
jgi:hypothetical protein